MFYPEDLAVLEKHGVTEMHYEQYYLFMMLKQGRTRFNCDKEEYKKLIRAAKKHGCPCGDSRMFPKFAPELYKNMLVRLEENRPLTQYDCFLLGIILPKGELKDVVLGAAFFDLTKGLHRLALNSGHLNTYKDVVNFFKGSLERYTTNDPGRKWQ